uniref:Uncharacterized protein n=1 Tax=viral metagenome TaxID=1070528 RepID=A0A6H1ZKF1_9ZZZZ
MNKKKKEIINIPRRPERNIYKKRRKWESKKRRLFDKKRRREELYWIKPFY